MRERFNFYMLVLLKFCTCKAAQKNDIPISIVKQNADIFLATLVIFFNFCVNEGKFPNLLNLLVASIPILAF